MWSGMEMMYLKKSGIEKEKDEEMKKKKMCKMRTFPKKAANMEWNEKDGIQ